MRALVTGATGFIGSHLVEGLIQEGFDVTCLVRATSDLSYLEGRTLRLVEGDCTNRVSLTGVVRDVDYIFHLAGLTKARSEAEFFDVNVRGTENMLSASRESSRGLKRFLYLSSLAAAGPSKDRVPLNEESEPQPVSEYGRTKFEGERIVYAQRGALPVTIVRPPAVYGPRDRDLLIFFKMVKAGIVPYWGKSYYSFIYVEDLVTALIRSAVRDEGEGEIFFVSDGTVYSNDDVIDAIAEALEKSPMRMRVPKCVMPLVGLFSEKTRGATIINRDKVREMSYTHWICDNHKAVSRLAFTPKVKMREGARWTADWYRIHRWL